MKCISGSPHLLAGGGAPGMEENETGVIILPGPTCRGSKNRLYPSTKGHSFSQGALLSSPGSGSLGLKSSACLGEKDFLLQQAQGCCTMSCGVPCP